MKAEWGDPVCANGNDKRSGFLVTTTGFVFHMAAPELIPFSSITDYEVPDKSHKHDSLEVKKSNGETLKIPLLGGCPFNLIRFLGSVIGEEPESTP